MNDWMCPDLNWDDSYVPDRGKVSTRKRSRSSRNSIAISTWTETAFPYRTMPGVHPKGAYFTRGSGHTQYGVYTEDSAEYQIVLDRLTRKFATAKRLVPKPVIEQDAHIDIAVVGLRQFRRRGARGARHPRAARHQDQLHAGCVPSPFGEEVDKFLAQQKLVFVVEQNRDAQMRSLLTLETHVEKSKLRSLLHYSGLPISSEFICQGRAGRRSNPRHANWKPFPAKVSHDVPAQPKVRHPSLPKNSLGTHAVAITRVGLSTLCAGCGHESITRGHHRGVLGHRHRAAEHGQAVGHWLLVEDHGLFRERAARIQLRPWPHAVLGHGCECREPRSHVHRRLG
jgi:hypothetical protein